jgi:hypothetical protein
MYQLFMIIWKAVRSDVSRRPSEIQSQRSSRKHNKNAAKTFASPSERVMFPTCCSPMSAISVSENILIIKMNNVMVSLELIRDEKRFREFPKTALCAMNFGAVSRGGRSPLTVSKSDSSLNQYTYKEECLIPMLQNLPHSMIAKTGISYQDKTPCHAARTFQSFLEEEMPCLVRNGDIPNSSDLNVLDYSICSYLKERLNKHGLISSFNRLKKILQEEWEAIPQQLIQDSIDSWLSRLRKVEKARGGHIK